MSSLAYMYGMRDMNVPCQNCESRQVGCHGTCERYKDFKEKRAEQKAKVVAYKREHNNPLFVNKHYIPDSTLKERKRNGYFNVLNSNKRGE